MRKHLDGLKKRTPGRDTEVYILETEDQMKSTRNAASGRIPKEQRLYMRWATSLNRPTLSLSSFRPQNPLPSCGFERCDLPFDNIAEIHFPNPFRTDTKSFISKPEPLKHIP